MKKTYLGVALAVMAFGMVACSGTDTTDGGSDNCNTDSDCATGNLCNTIAHVCMQSCTAGSDCPDTAKNCAVIPNGGTSDKVCQCSTSALCNSGNAGGSAICNTYDNKCEVACSDDTGCQDFVPARSCVQGQCVGGTTTDAGSDCNVTGCVTGTCNTATGVCETTDQCDTTAAAPGGCAYGQLCDSLAGVSTCTDVAQCSAVSAPPAISSGSSPVIYDVVRTGHTRQDSNCVDANSGNSLDIVEFQGSYYDPDGNVDTGATGVYNSVKYVKPSGTTALTYEKVSVSSTTFTFEICAPVSSIHAGVVLLDHDTNISNTACLP